MSIHRVQLFIGAAVLGAVAVLATVGVADAGLPYIDEPVDEGSVTVVDIDDPSTEYSNGASATIFTLRLPDGATCPGDSANDQWRVNSFIIPADRDPAELKYLVNDPEGEGNYSLYGANTNPYISELTLPNATAGLPGKIPEIRPLSFGVFPPGTLPDGRYRMGLACSYFADTGTYWDTEIVIVDDSEDEPGQMVWSIPFASSSALDATNSPSRRWAWVAAAAFAAVGIALLMWQRQSREAEPSEEHL